MQVEFREFNPFDVWLWLELEAPPQPMEKQYLETLFDSWFFLGKLGGFNAENLQVQETGLELSYLTYDVEQSQNSLMALMHNASDLEYQGNWARAWFDLGTSDAIALDVLINALQQLSAEYVSIQRLIIGGENEDWPIPDREDDFDADSRSERLYN
ncbi:DUF3531 family protein [Trichothermofontia sp.]